MGEVVVAGSRRIVEGQDHQLASRVELSQVPVVAQPTGQPVRLDGDVDWPPGLLPRSGQRPHLEDVDRLGAEVGGAQERDVGGDAPVEVVVPVELDDGEDRRKGGGGQDRLVQGAGAEPPLGRRVELGGHALERDLQLVEAGRPQDPLDQLPEPGVVVQGLPSSRQLQGGGQATGRRHDVGAGEAEPEVLEALDAGERGIGRVGRPVQRADRAAQHEVRTDAALDQCPEHAYLKGAEVAAAGEDERRGPRSGQPAAPAPDPVPEVQGTRTRRRTSVARDRSSDPARTTTVSPDRT